MTSINEKCLRLLSQSNLPILLSGAVGGNECAVARRIHKLSTRSQLTFLSWNPPYDENREDKLTDELEDLFSAAEGGTLFIQNIAILTDSAQEYLLNYLCNLNSFMSVVDDSGSETLEPKVRLITSTEEMPSILNKRYFNSTLLDRIRGIHMELERPTQNLSFNDLVIGTIEGEAVKQNKKILSLNEDFVECLELYDWSEDFEKLRKILVASVKSCSGTALQSCHFPANFLKSLEKAHVHGSTVLNESLNSRNCLDSTKMRDHNRSNVSKAKINRVTAVGLSTLWKVKSRAENPISE